MQQNETATSSSSYLRFLARLLTVVGVVVVALALWRVREALLLVFAALIVATIVGAAADPVRRLTGLSQKWSAIAAVVVIALVLAVAGWLVGGQIATQLGQLAGQVPTSLSALEERTGLDLPTAESLRERVGQAGSAVGGLFGQLAQLGWTMAGVVASIILIVIGGVFLALDPDGYRRGLVRLFPRQLHAKADLGFLACGRALRLWLVGQLISMSIVGALILGGAWLLGLPAPLALALIAGLAEFVPYVGPIAAAIPALLFAFTQSTSTALWTLLLYAAVQQLESNIIMPKVEKEMVNIPPAVFMFSVVGFGLLFGLLGILLAAPLTVVAFVAIRRLYLGEALNEG